MSTDEPKVGIISLGCPKALVDSEQIINKLRVEGYAICPTYEDADLVVVNTCGFIDSAIEESLETISEALSANGKVIVTGCMGAKGNRIREQFPDLLAVTGPHAAQAVMDAVHQHLPPQHDPLTSLIPAAGIKLTPKHYAYLKISEGCNHRCSFCIIPSMRGDLISRPINEVMDEAQNLVNSGVKELLVISQDTSAYGIDIKYKRYFWQQQALQTRLYDLAKALGQLGVWIRMHYIYPYPHVDKIIPLMSEGLILPYLDIPFQHASQSVLQVMKRPAHSENILRRLEQWRSICPDIKIRSTFIVGFPGETEQDFEELLEFIQAAQLDRVGCFTYSAVEGAAANQITPQVDEATKLERQARFMHCQELISRQKLTQHIGQSVSVIIDQIDIENKIAIARSYGDAPEIDGVVQLELKGNIEQFTTGQLYEVTITDTDTHDMYATVSGT